MVAVDNALAASVNISRSIEIDGTDSIAGRYPSMLPRWRFNSPGPSCREDSTI